MTAKKKISARVMAMLLAVVLILSAFPMSAFAAVASDLPDEMADHAILRALEYTGYDVQKQKDMEPCISPAATDHEHRPPSCPALTTAQAHPVRKQ